MDGMELVLGVPAFERRCERASPRDLSLVFDEGRQPDLVMTGEGICTPFIVKDTLYYGYHNGRTIWSYHLLSGERRAEFKLEDSECYGHISSPAVYGATMLYHGPDRNGPGQRTFKAIHDGDRWIAAHEGPVGPPYMRRGPGATHLAKERGIATVVGGEVISRIRGPYRHAHFHDGWIYFSTWGEAEFICRMKEGIVETFYRPDIPYQRTSSGPARHRHEVRDPFINDEYFACVCEGEREIRVWKL